MKRKRIQFRQIQKQDNRNLDTIRDKILLTAGDTVFDISNKTMRVEPFTNFTKRKAVNNKLNTTDPQYGLCLKKKQQQVKQ